MTLIKNTKFILPDEATHSPLRDNGTPADWAIASSVADRDRANFTSSDAVDYRVWEHEPFDWHPPTVAVFVSADFSGDDVEDFSEWLVPYFLELEPSIRVAALFDGGPATVEEFDWITNYTLWSEITKTGALFDAGTLPEERFEAWGTSYTLWSEITKTGALFDGAILPEERFEGTWSAMTSL